jgi:hypothetical protein
VSMIVLVFMFPPVLPSTVQRLIAAGHSSSA